MKIVLYQPQIPQNTGNIARTCAATGTSLVLIKPLGFSTHSRHLKRAGLDYWDGVDIEELDDIEPLLESQLQNSPPQQNRPFEPFCRRSAEPYSPEYVLGGGVRAAERPRQTGSKSSIFLGREVVQLPLEKKNFFFFSSKAKRAYTETIYPADSILIFGSETSGLPAHFKEKWPDRFFTIPMVAGHRSLNLASSAAIVLYEALRQNYFSFPKRSESKKESNKLKSAEVASGK